jgi:hypothetical protein
MNAFKMRQKFLYAYLIFLFFTCSSTNAAENKQSLRLSKVIELPAAGIRFRTFNNFRQMSIPPIPTYTYDNKQTGQRLETYDPFDLWRHNQQIARFQGDKGMFELATLKHLIPQKLPLINNNHVIESDYVDALDGLDIKWNDENIRTWVELFAGKEVDSTVKRIRGMYLRYNYLRFTFKELPREEKQAFVLGYPEGKKVFFLFHFEKGLTGQEADNAIWSLLKTVLITGNRNIVTSKGKHFQDHRTNVHEKKGSKFETTRKRVISEIKNLKGWWYVETKNYVIKSNLTYKNRTLALLIQKDIEIMRKAYSAFFPPIKEIDEVSVVTVFKSREEYQQYIPPNLSWSGGVWIPGRKELVISPNYIGNRKVSNEEMLPTIYHEAFHQYLYYALDYVSPPIWYNEGHAMLFETCKIDRTKKTILVRENDRRMRVLESLIKGNQLDLEEIMSLSHNEFYQEDNLEQNYAISWALVYFFRKAGHMYKDRNYENVCDVILQELIKTKDWQKAAMTGMATINMQELKKDFLHFWTSKSKRRIAADYSLFDRQGNRAQ